VYYATIGSRLVVTLNEDLLRRALDRERQRQEAAPAPGPAAAQEPLGRSLTARVDAEWFRGVSALVDDGVREAMCAASWANIPILDEWRRRFPDEDPLAVHERVLGTRLVCPGGGDYVFDPDLGSHASMVYGHPARPRPGPGVPAAFRRIDGAAAGLTFEEGGLRARTVVSRRQ
jgi:hypothetical protein